MLNWVQVIVLGLRSVYACTSDQWDSPKWSRRGSCTTTYHLNTGVLTKQAKS